LWTTSVADRLRPRSPSGGRTPAVGSLVRPEWPQGCHDTSALSPARSLRSLCSRSPRVAITATALSPPRALSSSHELTTAFLPTHLTNSSTLSSSTFSSSLHNELSLGEATLPAPPPRRPHRSAVALVLVVARLLQRLSPLSSE
jgi:hypothetical protein